MLSNGRIDWGIGAGWLAVRVRDERALPFDRAGVRVDRLQEAVAVMKGCFGDEPVTFEGSHYGFATWTARRSRCSGRIHRC